MPNMELLIRINPAPQARAAEAVCLVPSGDRCGEAPLWCAEEGAVYWVDLNRFLIHRCRLESRDSRSWFFDEPVVALSLTDLPGVLLVALASRLLFWTPSSDTRREHGFRLPDFPQMRLNEGRTDPRGDFWVGSMVNNIQADGEPAPIGSGGGQLLRIRASGVVDTWGADIGMPNTLCWSPDRRYFYFSDSLENRIQVYDYDPDDGAIFGGRTLFGSFERGWPDGSAMDAEGCLWNCRYDGACVVRITPDGLVDRIVELPVQHATSCAFGGADLKTLLITTAASRRRGDRLGGSLFALRTEVQGQPENRFRLAGAA